jgi:hypothetical protein
LRLSEGGSIISGSDNNIDKITLPSEDEDEDKGLSVKEQHKLSINFKYWNSSSECLSEWQKNDLKSLRKTFDKVQGYTVAELRVDGGLSYKPHHGKVAHGFSRPNSLSKDLTLYEIRAGGKSRIHGFVDKGMFFIVWLDRGHNVFPER